MPAESRHTRKSRQIPATTADTLLNVGSHPKASFMSYDIYVRQKVGEALQIMLANERLKVRLQSASMKLSVLGNPKDWAGVSQGTKDLISHFLENKRRITQKGRYQRFFEMVVEVYREAGRQEHHETAKNQK